MEIYVVRQGDNIYSIAEKYGVSAERLIQDNGLGYPYNLVIGQTIVIVIPKQSHTVEEGDTLQSIADSYNVTLMQILRNNPYLADREYLYPGEQLVISYNTSRSITTNGFAYPYIRRETLIRTLPNLTYLSIFNYTATEKGEVITYSDDTEIVKVTKSYGVIPLLLMTTLSPQGVPNIETAYNILLNEEYQERNIDEFVSIMKRQGYLGINIIFNYLNENNQSLYLNFMQKISSRLQHENFLFFVTINYNVRKIDNELSVEQLNYSNLSTFVNGMIFLNFVWGTNFGPPAPVSDITHLRALIDYVTSDVPPDVPPDKITIGKPILGYNWQLPYIPNRSYATSLTINSVLDLAYEVGEIIQFDENSQTPYFYYNEQSI